MRILLALLVLSACRPEGVIDTPGNPLVEVQVRPDWPPERAGYQNPIPEENARVGDARWARMELKARNGEIEGYLDRVSARAGESVPLHVSASLAGGAKWQLYRLGWYGGAGARLVGEGPMRVFPQPRCPMEPTGRVRCAWPVTAKVEVPKEAVSGLYLVKLQRADGYGAWVPLVVSDERPADLLFQASVTTWQAYNDWGGASLYRDRTGTLPHRKAVEVSFDRPYTEGLGSGQLLRYEVQLAQFLERAGYDVAYTTNVEVSARDGAWLARRGGFISAGHDEYWTKSQRDNLESALARGMPLFFITANTAYWQIRLSEDRGQGARTLTGYKEAWAQDPVQGAEVTGRFRDPAVNRPENALLGVMFECWQSVRSPLVVRDAGHFLFEGTGLSEGDAVFGLMGYETDRRFDNGHEPAGLKLAASGGVVGVEGTTCRAEATSWRAPSGALVFATGSIEWSHALVESDISDSRVEQMSANVFREALGLEPALPLSLAPPPRVRIDGPFAPSVQTLATGLSNPVAVAPLPSGALAVVDAAAGLVRRIPPGGGVEPWLGAVPGGERFHHPTAILALADGRLVLADTGNHCLRMITPTSPPTLYTLAGDCGRSGLRDGPEALFTFPMGLAENRESGELYVADAWNHALRAVSLSTGEVRTVVQGGPLHYPSAVALDSSGRAYLVSSGNFQLFRVEPDVSLTLMAGGRIGADDGTGESARLGLQAGLIAQGDVLYASDAGAGRLRRIVPGESAAQTRVTTLAGSARLGTQDGAGNFARFELPLGLAFDESGALLVADAYAGSIRRVEFE